MNERDPVLTTPRLWLRRFVRDDARDLTRVFSDPYAARFYPDMAGLEAALRWIDRNLERYALDGFGLWAICLRGSDELVGDAGLTFQAVEGSREIEVGYHLRADQRGRGLAFEAARACLDLGFETHAAGRLVSMVHPMNTASCRLAARLHPRSRRFERLGDQYYLYYTERSDWTGPVTGAPG
jgi:ribosomal-protein-alanine N-acetyltransferase